ncbi:potassium channel subfamily K member 13-like, partial [Silurus meridionalis]
CCRWPWVNIDFARIVLLGLLLVLYMFFGAAVFSALERPLELEAYKIWDEKLAEFAQEHSVSPEDLHDLLKDYEEANNAGVWMQGQRMFWDFRGALCFVATVISTIGKQLICSPKTQRKYFAMPLVKCAKCSLVIEHAFVSDFISKLLTETVLYYVSLRSFGYGLAAPTTTNGRIFLIFFGLIGCSAAILLFNLFIERVITLITYVLSRCHEQKMSNKSQGAAASNLTTQPGGTTSGQEDWKPSVYHVTLIMLAVCFLVACTASGLYSAVEDWSYLESMYFCFVTFSTMGFGDMVSGQEMPEEASCFYQVVNVLAIFLGVGCAYTLFNLIAIMIKAMLNWILGKVLC